MNRLSATSKTVLATVALGCFHPAGAWACAACYGQSDSAMARGFNWGILSLLGVVVMVLGGITTFFVFLGKRSAALAATTDPSRTTNHESRITSQSPSPDTH
jgi:hypothetical protein